MAEEIKPQIAKDPASKLLALVSHKLKTPLSIINGYSETILSTIQPGEMSSFNIQALRNISKQGQKMALLVDRLVHFSSINELKETDIKKEEINLYSVLTEVAAKCIFRDDAVNVNSSEETMRRKGPNVEIKCSEETTISADKKLFIMALEELLDNSIKFNNNMNKRLKLFYYEEEGQDVVAIADNGVGIKEEESHKIFETFYQVDDFFTGQIEGWGLGLALVKRIMALHKGHIAMRSQYGVGTIISLKFPKPQKDK
ncbi:MAG: HAMP domain-containing histidine kinase [Elusimicrobiaceae bacterium]|nr:HAMP domain-containing histidine kinase [Elusimicrobiaceae bacterium]